MFYKKGKAGLLVLALFVCFAFISCTCPKKQVKPPQGVTPAAEEKVTPPPAPAAEKTPEVKMEELKAAQAKQLQEEIQDFETTMIHFDFDKADLTPKAREILKKKAEWLLKHKEFNVKIEGYCDERGTEEYNLALGQRRAEAAKKYLIELGVSPDRISTISYGEENPIDPRHCEEAWAKNRRDEFKLIKR